MKNGKNFKLLFTLALFLIVLGCNKDDSHDAPNPVNNAPSDFEISITDITSSSAKISWTASTSVEPTTVLYSIYLNDSLFAENLTETAYNLESLSDSTKYNVVVKATNEFGTAKATNTFTTAVLTNLRLKQYHYRNGQKLNIEYNDDHQITRKYIYEDLDTRYLYNSDGNIISEDFEHSVTGRLYANYTYNANQELVQLITKEGYVFGYKKCNYNFDSSTNYTYTRIVFDDIQNTTTYNYSVILSLNEDGNIVRYDRLNVDTTELETTFFEYTNGNVTKMITPDGKVLEILYDNKRSFHTYKSRFPKSSGSLYGEISDVASFIYTEDINIHFATSEIPKFYHYVNKNNPLEYKLNGQVKTTFEYEYNENDYPSNLKVNFEDGTTTGVINLNYQETL